MDLMKLIAINVIYISAPCTHRPTCFPYRFYPFGCFISVLICVLRLTTLSIAMPGVHQLRVCSNTV